MSYLSKSFVSALVIVCLIVISTSAKSKKKNNNLIQAADIPKMIKPPKQRIKPETVKNTVITVAYGAVACTCAQWVIYPTQNREYIYLERTNKRLIDANDLWDGAHLPLLLKLTGSFYKNKGIPPNYREVKGSPDSARIFKYRKIEILSTYFRNKKHWRINTN